MMKSIFYTASTGDSTKSELPNLKVIDEKMREIDINFFASFSGIPYTVDHSGLMCAPNSYVLMVGTELDKRLRGLK